MDENRDKLETTDDEAEAKRQRGTEPVDTDDNSETKLRSPFQRHMFMLVTSAIVMAIVLLVSYYLGETLYDPKELPTNRFIYIIPFFTALAGVLLFIMNTSRKKRGEWRLREYWGDHVFRIAQAFAYLFIIMWAWARVGNGGVLGTDFSPNILGFLVGFFILRVERAMEGLGDKFEETLMAILPRSVAYMSAEERRRQQLRAVYKLDEIATQYDAIRSQVEDPALRQKLEESIAKAQEAAEGEDPDKAKKRIAELARNFDDVKQSRGEMIVPVEDLIGQRRP